ncbi:MAG: hypothetical protein AAGC81_14860 [Pseudomonadota bacterium]
MTTTAEPGQIEARPQGYLWSPVIDLIALGGGSLPIMIALVMLPPEEYRVSLLATVFIASHFINNPHFMHSYQIFYDRFGEKIAQGAPLRLRYIFAGILVPILMAGYFLWSIVTLDAALMGQAVNAMLFLVGWHYVKQGYGILIVESVLKKAFFNQAEKDWLKYNAFAVWISSWVTGNVTIVQSDYYGLSSATLGLPEELMWATWALAAATSLIAGGLLIRRRMRGPIAINGLLAYLTAVYVWMVIAQISPLLLIIVPTFHSLQYLAVVWRYQLNKSAKLGETIEMFSGLVRLSPAQAAMLKFFWIGMCLGAVAFWVMPLALDAAIAYHEEIFGPSMFLFLFVVFINVHHYFLDNVMWRKENPDIREHLFG